MTAPPVVETELRVRYAETDAQGIVYYANYLVWFEVARVSHLRSLGQDYREWERRGFGIAIVQAVCNYRAPARFDDPIRIESALGDVGASSFRFDYSVFHGGSGTLLAQGHTVQAFVDLRQGRAIPIPDELRHIFPPQSR